MTIATLTSKGQVTIPKGIRELLGLQAGDRIGFFVNTDGTVMVKPCSTALDDVQGILATNKRVSIEHMDRALAAFHARKRK